MVIIVQCLLCVINDDQKMHPGCVFGGFVRSWKPPIASSLIADVLILSKLNGVLICDTSTTYGDGNR